MKKNNKSEDTKKNSSNNISNQYGAYVSTTYANASDAMIEGMEEFLEMCERMKNKGQSLRAGHLLETIIAAKKNSELALQGKEGRYVVKHLEGDHKTPSDLDFRVNGRTISEAQVKFSVLDPKKIIEKIADRKYENMQIFIPSDKLPGVREEIGKRIGNSTDINEIEYYKSLLKRIQDTNTTTKEVIIASKNSNLYAMGQELLHVGTEAAVQGGVAAATSFVVTGAIKTMQNLIAYKKGEKTSKEALDDTICDSSKAAIKGGATGVGAVGIRYSASKLSLGILKKSAIASSVASGLIDIGSTIYRFSKGQITSEQAIEEMGQNTFSTISGMYAGLAAGSVFGPPGALIGSIAGYLISSYVYQSSIIIFNQANLAEKESEKIILLCNEAIREMQEQRATFEILIEEHLTKQRHLYLEYFNTIDDGLNNQDYEKTILGLAKITELLGKELKLISFDDFDKIMQEGETLKI